MKSEAKDILAVVGVFAKLQEKDNPKLEPLVISVVEFQAGGKNRYIFCLIKINRFKGNFYTFWSKTMGNLDFQPERKIDVFKP